jgi:AAA15 family ATPase/GTPase
MLRKFSVKNYRNFKDEITMDFTSVRDYKYNSNCIDNDLLSKILIIGKNGSGKSNLGYALFDIVCMLTDNQPGKSQIDIASFINGNSKKKCASFNYEFQHENKIIQYEYRKSEPKIIQYEKLVIDGNLVFERDYIKHRGNYTGIHLVNATGLKVEYCDNSLSLLRYIANNTPQPENSHISFLMNYVNRMLYFRSAEGNTYIGFTRNVDNLDQFIMKNGLIKDFENYLKDVAGLEMKLDKVSSKGMPDLFVQTFDTKRLPFTNIASSGTKALELFYYWSKKFGKVSFLFIDEFDAYYHYELSEAILKQLVTLTGVQIILTSHNTSLLSNELMRPDCYFQINNGKLEQISESTDRELREGHNLEKMLRNGEFQ